MILKGLLPNWVVLEEIDKEIELGFGFSATSETPEQGYRVVAINAPTNYQTIRIDADDAVKLKKIADGKPIYYYPVNSESIQVGDIVVCDSTPKKKKIKGQTFIFEHVDNIIASFKEDEII